MPQAASSVEQLPNIVSLLAEAAQAAIASALSCSCEAFSSCTSSALASIENPRLLGSLNTVAIGAAAAVSLKMARMLAVSAGALRRQSLRGPGALLLHAIGGVSACLGGVTVGPAPPVPVGLEPAVPDPAPAVPLPDPAVPEPLPAVPEPLPAVPEPLPAVPAPLPAVPAPFPAVPEPFPPVPGSPGGRRLHLRNPTRSGSRPRRQDKGAA